MLQQEDIDGINRHLATDLADAERSFQELSFMITPTQNYARDVLRSVVSNMAGMVRVLLSGAEIRPIETQSPPKERPKVYVVLIDTYTDYEIPVVFSTRQQAEAFVGDGTCKYGRFERIQEVIVDPEEPRSLQDYE